MECCFQDLFNIARSILVQLPSSFISKHLVSIHVVHPDSSIDTTVAWKKCRFDLSDRSDFHIIDSQLIAVHGFVRHILSLSVDETLLPRYGNLSTNFRGPPFWVEMALSWLKYVICFVYIHVEANATCSLF